MKKLLLMVALIGLPVSVLTGCGGGGEPSVVEATSESDGSLPADQQQQYEEMMKSGGSAKPGN